MKLIKVFLLIMFIVPFGFVASAVTSSNLAYDKIAKSLPLESSKNEKRSVDLDHRTSGFGFNKFGASVDENRSVDLDHRSSNFAINSNGLKKDTNISLGMNKLKNGISLSTTSPPEEKISDVDNFESNLSVNKNSNVTLPLLE